MANELIAEAITDYYGERCPDFDAECFCCKAWSEYDALVSPTPCDELVTVAYATGVNVTANIRTISIVPEDRYFPDPSGDSLVTRQNAEEVIAAERMKLEATAKVGLQLSKEVEILEADNKRLREALEEYTEARDAYEAATKPSGGFGTYRHLNHADPILIRYREARAALGEVK